MNKSLHIAALLSFMAALLHVFIILGGPDWYRFFGAGESMAQLAENGSSFPAMVTITIALLLSICGLFALSGAGIIRKLPLLKPALLAIAIIFLLRGMAGIPVVIFIDDPYLNELAARISFMIVSSIISTAIGILYLTGFMKATRH